jgi:hypothetical protein
METMDRQRLALLPSPDGGDVTSEVSGNLFPRFETTPVGIQTDVGS